LIYARIADLLKQTMGLDAESIGVACVERAVRKRLVARKLADPLLYWAQLCASEQELQELIEAIVVPETWFFRDAEAFAALVRVAREQWLAKHVDDSLRALSLPCSTGEEPFSMAMALLDGALPATRFQIDAVDISARALAFAERGIYGRNSFRAKDLGFRDRYFEPVERGHRVSASVRAPVTFRQGNLLSPGSLPAARTYDVIFCRNVLIYFDRDTQRRALEVLGRLLSPSGVLFVGPSETGLLHDRGFAPAGIPLAFAFRHAGGGAPRPTRNPVAAVVATQPVPARPRQAAPVAAPQAIAVTDDWLERARHLANQGNLVDALSCCERHLQGRPVSAEAFHLVGLLHDAAGRVREAAEHYRKALYLEPRHPEALAHLAVALQKEGDPRGAQRLLERANRLPAAGGSKRGG
jgi:chemotaxis protein methyltransferase WspC